MRQIAVAALAAMLAALAAMLAAPATAAAEAGSTPSQAFDLETDYPVHFRLAGNERGDRILIWAASGRFRVARAAPGEGFGAPRDVPLTRADIQYAYVAMDEEGNTLLLWRHHDGTNAPGVPGGGPRCCWGLRARILRADGTVSPQKTLAPRRSDLVLAAFATGPGGRVGVVFHRAAWDARLKRARRSLEARFGSVARGLGARERVPLLPFRWPLALSLAGERARLVHPRQLGDEPAPNQQPYELREFERVRRGRYKRLATLVRANLAPASVLFATAADGHQAAVWRVSEGDRVAVMGGTRPPGGSLDVRRLAGGPPSDLVPGPPAVAAGGRALVAWGTEQGVLASQAVGGGPFDSPRVIERRSGPYPHEPAYDVAADGVQLVAVNEAVGFDARLIGLLRDADGNVLAREAIEDGAGGPAWTQPEVTLDAAGRGTIAYARGSQLRIVAARAR